MRITALQVAALLVIVAGLVILTLKDKDVGTYIGVVTPILTALFVIQAVNSRSDSQDQVLSTIHENTNGILKQKIKDAVAEALTEQNRQVPPAE